MSATAAHLDLPIQGMACASCASRIERRLNELNGVSATVNFATEKATVDYDEAVVTPQQLVESVQAAGYSATLPAGDTAEKAAADTDDLRPLRLRLLGAAVLSLPVLLVSMIPSLQFDHWQWLALQLATPVVV